MAFSVCSPYIRYTTYDILNGMYLFTLFSIFALGAIIGSFLNVVVLRTGTGIGFFRSSFCFVCRAGLRWYELAPIFSFVAQRGRCRTCRAKIHFQYPLVEALTGFLFVFVWLREMGVTTLLDIVLRVGAYENTLPRLALLWAIASVLLVIAAYDIRHKIIPNAFVYAFIVLAFTHAFSNLEFELLSLIGNWEHLLGHLTSGLVFFILFAALWLVSRGTWMGFGDAKLAAGIGVLFGFDQGGAAIILSFLTGALVSLALLALARFKKTFPRLTVLTMKSEIPFAPFLILGVFLVYFFNIGFLDIAEIFIIN